MAETELFARFALAAVFLCSSVSKLWSLSEFDEAVRTLGRLPARFARPVGLAVIVSESAVCVLLAIPGTARYGFALAGALLLLFTGLLARALRAQAAGGTAVSCACFGAGTSTVSGLHLARNGALLALTATGIALPAAGTAASLTSTGPAAAVASALLLALVIVLLEDLAFLYGPER